MATKQQFLITAVINGVTYGVFDRYSGGDAVADARMHRPGGMGDQKSYVTLAKYSNMTIGRVLERQRDWELTRTLKPIAGRVLASVTIQPLDQNGAAWGTAQVASGRFLGVKGIDSDSDSDEIEMYELEFAIEHWA